jgi:alpha-beta hydrolase superfamily lysophospholipase
VTTVDPIASNVPFERHRVRVETGVELVVDHWAPATDQAPLVFIAGWISVIEGWRDLLEVLVRDRAVYYVRTREKRSATFAGRRPKPSDFAIPRLGDDVIAVCDELSIDADRRVFFASSMGSNAVLEAMKHDRLRARGAFLIGPNAVFRFPWWGHGLVLFPASLYHLLRPFVVWYLRRFRVNTEDDPDQMKRYERTLRAAHPYRLKQSARAVLGYSLLPGLDTVRAPVAIAYAASDTLHEGDEARRIVDALPRGEAVECPTNSYMHSASVANELRRFEAKL